MNVSVSVVLTLIALHGASASVTPAQSSGTDSSYFPLSLGNEWSFSSRFFPHTEKITDTATVNGKLYYGLTIWAPYIACWFRCSNDSVFVARTPNDTTEGLLFDFTADVGDTIVLPTIYGCEWGNKLILASKEDTVSTSAGAFTHCFHFRHISHCVDAGMLDSWFARGVGRVKYVEDNIAGLMTYDLVGYSLVTKVEPTISKPVPDSYTLFECYPNPFNPSTTIRYGLPHKSAVQLVVFNTLGQQVATLVQGEQEAGYHEVKFHGNGLSSGVYFYRLTTGSFVETKKVLLLR